MPGAGRRGLSSLLKLYEPEELMGLSSIGEWGVYRVERSTTVGRERESGRR